MTEEELRALLGNEQHVNDIPPDADDIPPVQIPAALPEIPADPFAEYKAPESGVTAAETEDTAAALPPKPNRHVFLYTMLTLLVAGVLAFAVFCVIWDIRNGTTSGNYRAGNIVKVELIQHRRSDEADTEPDENGKYTLEGIAENVMPSIVEIYTYKDNAMNGAGSGIILSEDGFIATNAHVVQDVTDYSVRLYGESQKDSMYRAVLVGRDRKTDLAVLKIDANGLKPARLGNSDDVHIGETVCALGNPAGLSSSITTGIISGVNRKVRAKSDNFEMECLQTDAAISPGNSGGALVDLYGQVIGIVSSKYGNSIVFGGDYEGLGFAITINQALPILKELAENGYISGRVRIGINYLGNSDAWDEAEKKNIKIPEELRDHGIWITNIAEDSPLNDTPVQVNDWILTMDGQEVTDGDSVQKVISGKVGGDSMHCRCARMEDDGTVSTFEIDFVVLEDQSGDY